MNDFELLGYSIDLPYSVTSNTSIYFALIPTEITPAPPVPTPTQKFTPIIIFI